MRPEPAFLIPGPSRRGLIECVGGGGSPFVAVAGHQTKANCWAEGTSPPPCAERELHSFSSGPRTDDRAVPSCKGTELAGKEESCNSGSKLNADGLPALIIPLCPSRGSGRGAPSRVGRAWVPPAAAPTLTGSSRLHVVIKSLGSGECGLRLSRRNTTGKAPGAPFLLWDFL